MLFFQVMLCGGYAYSHLITARMPERIQVLIHVTLLTVALLSLKILPSATWKPTAQESPVLTICLLLLSTVGLPYFVLSTTGPLLLRWFSLIQPETSPYRLYALSNAASLLALLTYPLLVEPLLRISVQAEIWSSVFFVFTGLCAVCAFRLWLRSLPTVEPLKPSGVSGTRVQSATRSSYVLWFLLAMVASTVLLAETNEVCQDVAVIPFLWVIPLSLYLLSFILCFESDRWYQRGVFALGTAVLVLAVCWLQSFGLRTFLPLQLVIYFACLFSICMLCHGELARLRPDAKGLTAFYLTVSLGGAGGGLFVGIVAPLVFPAFWEHYLGLIAASVIAVVVYFDHRRWLSESERPQMLWTGLVVCLFVGVGTVFLASILNYRESIAMVRNFYGVLEVETDEIEDAIVLRHGRIMHGLQVRGVPSLPTMYYGFRTGVGRAIEELRERKRPLKMGLVGLGTGTLAVYGQPDDTLRFYEINKNVTKLAQEHFTFLKQCRSRLEIIHGDARLVMENESPQEFDLLVLDAFSGDAIPTHLLTKEAMQSWLRHVRDDGLMAFHISNLHFDLRRVTEALAAEFQLHTVTLETPPRMDPATGTQSLIDPGSRWVLITREEQFLESPGFDDIRVREPLPAARQVLWTDDFSNLIQILDW